MHSRLSLILVCTMAGLLRAEEPGLATEWKTELSKGATTAVQPGGGIELSVPRFEESALARSQPIALAKDAGLLKIAYRSEDTTVDAGVTGCAEVVAVFPGGERRAVKLPVADGQRGLAQLPLDPPAGAATFTLEVAIRGRITKVTLLSLTLEATAYRRKIVCGFETPESLAVEISERTETKGENVTEVKWAEAGLGGKGALAVLFGKSGADDGKHVGFKTKDSPLRDLTEWDAIVVDIKNLSEYPVRLSGQVADDNWKKLKPSLSLAVGAQGKLAFPLEALKRAGVDVQKIASVRVFVWGNMAPVQVLIDNVRLVKGDEPEAGAPLKKEVHGKWTVLQPAEVPPPPALNAAENELGAFIFQRPVSALIFPYTRPLAAERAGAEKALQVALAKDEFEPIQVGVLATKDIAGLAVEIQGCADLSPDVRWLDFLQQPVGPEAAKTCTVFPCDLLHRKSVDVSAGSCTGFWVTFHAQADATAGTRKGKLILKAGPASREIPLEVTVRPFVLPKPDKIYCMFMTGTYYGLQKGNDPKQILPKGDKDLQDMADHGMNCVSPEIWCDYKEKDGHPWFPEIETLLERSPRFGLDLPVLWYCGTPFQTQKVKNGRKRNDWKGIDDPTVDRGDEERRELAWTNFNHQRDIPNLKKTVAYFKQFAKNHGVPEPLYMVIDEPNEPPRNKLAADVLKAVRESGGLNLQTCTLRALEPLNQWVDLVVHAGAPPVAFVREHHKQNQRVVFYDNSTIFGPHHHRARVLFGVNVWHTELDGAGAWSHLTQINEYRVPDAVTGKRTPVRDEDYSTVPNLNWELIREGVDDYRYIMALTNAAKKKPEIRAEADALFAQMHAALKDNPALYVFSDGPLDWPSDQGAPSPAQVERWRASIAALLEKAQ
jgi:hypothetical protein